MNEPLFTLKRLASHLRVARNARKRFSAGPTHFWQHGALFGHNP